MIYPIILSVYYLKLIDSFLLPIALPSPILKGLAKLHFYFLFFCWLLIERL